MIFLITYDLNRPGQVYSLLEKKLGEIAVSGVKPCETVWVIEAKTGYTADTIARALNTVTDNTDKLLVVRLTNDWQGFGLDLEHGNWLKKYLS